jgi:hypothetical protein
MRKPRHRIAVDEYRDEADRRGDLVIHGSEELAPERHRLDCANELRVQNDEFTGIF